MEKIVKTSIIIRAYNSEATIARALESALAQDFTEPYEVIVVDDGSTDGTVAVVESLLKDKRVRILKQGNKGAAGAAKTGVAASQGDLVMFLDADDELLPITLSQAARALDDKSVDYAYGDYAEEYKGTKKRVVAGDPFKVPAGALVWRRVRLQEMRDFEAETVFPEYELLLHTWGSWKGTHIAEALFIYHRRDASITGDKMAVQNAIDRLRKKFPARAREIDMIRSYDPLAI